MNVGKTVVFLGALGLAGGLAAFYWKRQAEADADLPAPHTVNTDKGHAKVAKVVEKTLSQHQGEESPVVQAFQQALASEK